MVNKKMYKTISVICMAGVLMLGGCGSSSAQKAVDKELGQSGDVSAGSPVAGENSEETVVVAAIDPEEMFSDRDFETDYDENKSTRITLKGSSAECSGSGAEISGSTVTIREEGTYILSGSLEDGMIVVDGGKEEKIQLVLEGVEIHSADNAPIYIKQSDKVFITLAEGSKNSLSNGGSFAAIDENETDAVIFSKEDLTINGEGALAITSPAGHGVVSKDELTVTGGSFDISCSSHGFSGKDGIGIANGTFHIVSGKDGIHAENKDDATLGYLYVQNGSFEIEAAYDGVSAAGAMLIDNGTFDVVSGGGSQNASSMSQSDVSCKGIKATELTINNGSFTLDAGDDAVHANGSIVVNNGSFAIATGDDGFHADDTLTVNAGIIDISTSYEGLEALHMVVAGGEISLVAEDDGLNAAGGTDSSGFGGKGGNDMFGRGGGRFGGGMFEKGDKTEKGSRGERQRGEMSEMPEGMSEMPQMNGEMPGNPFGGDSSGSITISGGNLFINSSGDGMDANGSLTISGGNVVINGPTYGDTATLDYDTSAVISGGTFIGTGARSMAQTFSESPQAVVSVNVGNVAAKTQLSLKDQAGVEFFSYAPVHDYNIVILSSPDLVSGATYTLTVGSETMECTAK